ncbi:MAG TPA: two-component sensor histidine kinase [Clostridiales bacterium]|nr:two-component sensor histidine kinase [Clostridiales bacterium]
MKNKIRFRLLLYFSGSLLVFSLIIGLVFFALFSRHNLNVHKVELVDRATNIAEALAGFWVESPDQMQGHRMGGQGAGYGAYLRFLDDIAMTDVWIVDRNLDQITRGHGQASLAYNDLPAGAEDVIIASMDGKTTFSENFGAFIGTPSITVAAPITFLNGEVAGVVLLHERIESIRGETENGLLILLLSMGTAVVISFFIARALAERFTKPLDKMKTAALRISGGDYSVKTDVAQDDEIGELASALDDMAEKLNTASKESSKLEKLRRDFVANISHELRTPVTVIRGSLEALCDGVVSESSMVEDYHRQMLSESIYLERLVSDLLDLARLQNPDFTMDMSEVNLKDIVQDAVYSIRSVAEKKSIVVRLSYVDQSFIVFGDYGRLRQILLIILDNAIKFSPVGEVVEVELTKTPDKITLSVRDQGPGIAADDLPYIFERFYKQRSETNKNGTGLGLAIAKQIADKHSAVLKAINRSDRGCEFILSISNRINDVNQR